MTSGMQHYLDLWDVPTKTPSARRIMALEPIFCTAGFQSLGAFLFDRGFGCPFGTTAVVETE